MRYVKTATAFVFASAFAGGFAVAQDAAPASDQPMTIGGVETVCTGTTTDTRADPRWRAYPLRIEFVGKDGQYLGDEQVTVTGKGIDVSAHCQGPWLLMKLPKGMYKMSADVADAGHKDMTISGSGHIVVRFANAGGVVDNGPQSHVANADATK